MKPRFKNIYSLMYCLIFDLLIYEKYTKKTNVMINFLEEKIEIEAVIYICTQSESKTPRTRLDKD